MKNIDFKGIFLGSFLAILGVLLIVIVSTLLKVLIFGSSEGDYKSHELIILLVDCSLFYLWAGFIISKTSSKGKILNPLIVGTLLTILTFLTIREALTPFWFSLVAGVMTMPLTYIGANLHLQMANKKVQNDPLSDV